MGLLGARQLVVSAGIVITVVALGLALPGGGSSQEAPPALDIAFSFNGGIHAMRPDGSGLRRLTGAPGATDVEPAWSPDGTRLAFVRGTVEAAESGRLYVLESAGGNPRPLTPADGSYVSEPTWSPDGDRIAIARWVRVGQDERESQIVVTDAGGGDEHVVVRERLNERYASVGEPAWSPDGARLAYTRSELDRSYHFRSSLYTVAAGGGQPQLLASEAADAAWSPDGSRIAYSGTRDRNGKSCGSDQCSYNGELYVMDADGANQVRLTRNRGYDGSPSWSPDGRRIAFASNRNNRGNLFSHQTEIYSVGADGSCLAWLTNSAPASLDPAWRSGPGRSSGPGGCGASPRPPRMEILTRALRARVPEGTPWLGERYGSLLLSHAESNRNGPPGRFLSFFHYNDCARFHVRDCARGLQVQVASVCSPRSRLTVFRRAGRSRVGRSLAKQGLLLAGLGRGSLSVIAGSAGVTMYAESGPGRAQPQLLAAARALRPFGQPGARLPAPALPRPLLRRLPARASDSLPQVRAVRC